MHRMICLIVGLFFLGSQGFLGGQARAEGRVEAKELLTVPVNQGMPSATNPNFNLRLAEANRLERSGRNLRMAGMLFGAIGVGFLGLSTYMFWHMSQPGGGWDDGGTGIVTGIIGAPLTITGLVMFGIGHSRIGDAQRLRESAVSITPTVTPVPGGAMVGLRLVHF